jgi:hypothetical protein
MNGGSDLPPLYSSERNTEAHKHTLYRALVVFILKTTGLLS